MFNKAIEKTSNEEGKYAEYIVEYLSREMNADYQDVSDNADFQRLDIDAIINGKRIEIKNDTIIHSSGNAVFEVLTHIKPKDKYLFDALLASGSSVKYNDIPRDFGSIGCNDKCIANDIFYISSIESRTDAKHYRLNWDEPAFIIDNIDFKKYVHEMDIPTNRMRIVFHPEDGEYNLIILFKIDLLINKGIAKRIKSNTLDLLNKKYKALDEYHTSEEIKTLLLESE